MALAPTHTERTLLPPIPDDDRPLCATRSFTPEVLLLSQLDEYLAQGWYRIGQRMMYCEYTAADRGTHGTLWTRVPLAGYTFRKSLRKLRRKVERDFEVTVAPHLSDDEHENLYARYLEVAPGERSEDLHEFLHGVHSERTRAFDTWEVTIRDGARLVAFSLFDRGEESLQSLLGAYDPDYAKHSLGFYTMLRELQYGIDEGMSYFYAGYVLCGDATMDYKLRTGHVEVLDRIEGRWRPFEEIDRDELDPLGRTRRNLEALLATPTFEGWQLHETQHFALGAYAPHLESCLPYPLALWRRGAAREPESWVLGYDSITEAFELSRCVRGAITSADGEVLVEDLIFLTRSVQRWPDAEAVLRGLDDAMR